MTLPPCEPNFIEFSVINKFKPEFDILLYKELEKSDPNGVFSSVRNGVKYDRNNKKKRYGLLVTLMKLKKK
jgi:hypothetical protein